MECHQARLHHNTGSCRIDFQPLARKHGGPRVGRILVTPLGNPWLTLLRFDVGDLVRLAEGLPCPCGLEQGLTVEAVEGRSRDLTLSPEGRAVTVAQVDEAVAAVPGITAYQVEQLDCRRYRLRFVAERGARRDGEEAAARLQALYGPSAEVTAQRETAIAPELSGKYRLAKACFPIETERLLWAAATRA